MALTKIDNANMTSGVLPVANGGTGSSTQAGAANAVLPTQTGNSGKYLTTDGSNASWGSVAAGLPGILSQIFTSSGTFTIPSGVTALKVTVVGGGGGGGSNGTGGTGTAGASSVSSGTQSITTIQGNGGQNGNSGITGGTATGGDFNIKGGNSIDRAGGGAGGFTAFAVYSNCAIQTATPTGGFLGFPGSGQTGATPTGYGNGGGSPAAYAGAGGGMAIKYLSGLTPGNTLSVTVGAAGTPGNAPYAGQTGTQGIVIFEW